MKGVILAGGLGTRLYPLTYVTNKHLLPVYDRPMIYYPIQTLVNAGITDILIVTSGPHVGHFLGVLKNGKELGIKHLEYAYQEKPDGGIADALSLAEDFSDREPITVILGDNTTDADISSAVKNFQKGATIFLKEVQDPERYGVAVFTNSNDKIQMTNQIQNSNDKKLKIIRIEEKPKEPKSNMAVTGIYIYDNQIFDLIRQTKPSGRGQLEITDVNNFYIQKGELDYTVINGFWSDAGTFDSLFASNLFWAKKSA